MTLSGDALESRVPSAGFKSPLAFCRFFATACQARTIKPSLSERYHRSHRSQACRSKVRCRLQGKLRLTQCNLVAKRHRTRHPIHPLQGERKRRSLRGRVAGSHLPSLHDTRNIFAEAKDSHRLAGHARACDPGSQIRPRRITGEHAKKRFCSCGVERNGQSIRRARPAPRTIVDGSRPSPITVREC